MHTEHDPTLESMGYAVGFLEHKNARITGGPIINNNENSCDLVLYDAQVTAAVTEYGVADRPIWVPRSAYLGYKPT